MALPPHDLVAEQALLGCLLIAMDQAEVVTMLGDPAWPRPDEFYDMRHRKIADTALSLVGRGLIVGLAAICSDLGTSGTASVGGIEYVSGLSDKAAVASNWRQYAESVRAKAKARAIIQQCRKAMDEAMETKEPDVLASKLAVDLGEISQRGSLNGPVPMRDVVNRTIEAIEARVSGESMVPTGFPDLDREMKGGMGPGEYVLIAARTSIGKTAVAVNIITNVGKWLVDKGDKRRVLFFSFESSVESMGERMLNAEAELDVSELALAPTEAQQNRIAVSSHRLANLPISIDERTDLTSKQIMSVVRAEHARCPLALVVIDYIQLIESELGSSEVNRATELGRISQTIKNGFKALKVPVIVVAQLNRKADDRDVPKKSDLRESGSLEQDAHFIGLLYARKESNDNPRFRKIAMRIDKNRRGKTGVDVDFVYEGAIYKFRPAAKVDYRDAV